MLWLNEDESFSLSGYVETPGEVRLAPTGYIVSHRSDGTYIAPLIPQLFYGADGTQLQTWRQNITQAGEQVILSRSGGQPSVPREELRWRKVSLPQRGAGLRTGRAGQRRYGQPRTEQERLARHLEPVEVPCPEGATCPKCGSTNIKCYVGGNECLDCGYMGGAPPLGALPIIIIGGLFLLLVLGKR